MIPVKQTYPGPELAQLYIYQGSMLRVTLTRASKNSQKQLRASKKRPQLVLQGQ